MAFQKMGLQEAIQNIKDRHQLSNYKLAKMLGLKQQIMIKRYLNGEVKSANVKVSYAIYSVYGILVDSFNSVEELKQCYKVWEEENGSISTPA